jgi:ABC-type glycerol-3-phosphate transport system substrate-binding protein
MNPSALWNLPAYRKIEDFEWDIVYDPVKDGVNKPGPWYGPDSLSIPTAAQQPDAGWEFLLFATGSPEGQRIMSATGIPTLKSEANNPDFLAEQSEAGPASFALVMDHAAEGKPFSSSPAWSEWMTAYNQTMGEVYNCNMDLQEALPIIHERVEEILAEAYAELDSL